MNRLGTHSLLMLTAKKLSEKWLLLFPFPLILKKQPPFGKDLLDGVLILPQFTLSANVNLVEKQIYIVVKQINPKFVCDSSSRGITLIIGDSTNETLFIDYRVQYFLVKFGIFERKVSLKNPSAASVTAHLVHNRIVGLDKSETITLRPNEQSSDPMEKELPVLQVSAPKRKSSEKGGRQAKQPKIPEYFTSPKKAPKRKNNSTTEAKKARSSHAECDRQMELLENDGIGVVDLTTENAASKDGDTGDNQAIEKNGANANQNVIEFIQSFKMPTKSVFKFIRPTKPLTDYPNVVDSEEIVEEPVGESENISNSVNAIPQTSPVLSPTNNARDKSFTKMTIKAPRQETHSNESNNSTNLRKDTAAKETGGEAKAATEENRDAYVPSCIKAMFGSQMVSQKVQNQMEKNVPSRKKDIQFRYDHLLTAAEEKEEEATTFAVNSQNYSLCDVIDGQHKLYRTPASRQSPAFPFRNLYIENFCAAKELEKIDQLSHSKNDVNDSEGSLFSLDYNTLPSQRSSLSSYQPKQQQQQPQRSLPEHQPLRMKEQQNKIALFQSKPMDKATPMTLNEHKYSKRNQFQKKLQTPQPCTPVRSPNEFQWTDKFQSSQKRPHKPVLTQPFYNNLLQRVVPAMSAEIVDHYSEPNVGFTSRNDGLF